MSVTLLWHSEYQDGPVRGLCIQHGEKLLFKRIGLDYKTSQLSLFRCTSIELQELEERHLLVREAIGGLNDYGELFKKRREQFVFTHPDKIVKYNYPEQAEFVRVVDFKDIINPWQSSA